jgi:hypothetical protein
MDRRDDDEQREVVEVTSLRRKRWKQSYAPSVKPRGVVQRSCYWNEFVPNRAVSKRRF